MDPIVSGIIANVATHYIIKLLDGSGKTVEVTWEYCGRLGCKSCRLPKVCAEDDCDCGRPKVCVKRDHKCGRRKMCPKLECRCGQPKVFLG